MVGTAKTIYIYEHNMPLVQELIKEDGSLSDVFNNFVESERAKRGLPAQARIKRKPGRRPYNA